MVGVRWPTHQVNNNHNNLLLMASAAFHLHKCLECIVDISWGGQLVGWSTLGLIISLPSKLCRSGIEVHGSKDAVQEVTTWNCTGEVDVSS